MSEVVVLVGDKTGKLLAELTPKTDSISWRRNNYGSAKFAISFLDAKKLEDYFVYGNLIAFQFTSGLPTWGGMLDTPRIWKDGQLEATAFSGEYLFKFRQVDKGRYFSGSTVGTIYQALIEEANLFQDFPIEIGSIWADGTVHSPEYHLKDLYTIFTKSLTERMSNAEFDVTASVENGYIKLRANFYERRGSDKSYTTPLIEGSNISENFTLKEQGNIINFWEVAGEGTGWDGARLTSIAQDDASISKYGLRQDSKVYSDVSIQTTLDTHARTLLSESKDPHNLYSVTAIDVYPAKFADYDIGDIVWLEAPSYGFGGIAGKIRIKAREFFPGSGKCALVVEDYYD